MPDNELDATLADGALRLHDWGVILAEGPDAATFLNGQLTQDMLHLADAPARLAGYCSPKGRLLASFVTWQPAPETIVLACSADVLAATLKRLSMYVLRAKCKLSDASAAWPLYGLAGPAADALLRDRVPSGEGSRGSVDEAQVIRLRNAAGVSRYLWTGLQAPPLLPLAPQSWGWLEVLSGVPRVVAATADLFVPQMLNFELLGGVNFKKGCYPGQEVVARSQFRGTIKRRTVLVHAAQALSAGEEVFHSDDPEQPAGTVVLAASLPDGRHAALVELKLAALASGSVHAGSAGGARLQPAALPYTLEPLTD
jgi:folate-binding protein YgfZ